MHSTKPVLKNKVELLTEKSSAAKYKRNHGDIAFLTLASTFIVLFVTGCSTRNDQSHHASRAHHHSRLAERSLGPSQEAQGTSLGATQIVTSSWYGPGYQGHRTASGERFDPKGLTAASKTLPLGSTVEVTNPRNGKSTQVEINDRGPGVHGRNLDLSSAAAQKIGLTKSGVAPVEIAPVSER